MVFSWLWIYAIWQFEVLPPFSQQMLVFHSVLERHWKTLVTPFCGRCQNFSLPLRYLAVKVVKQRSRTPFVRAINPSPAVSKKGVFSSQSSLLARVGVPFLPLKAKPFVIVVVLLYNQKSFFSIPSCVSDLALIYCHKKFLDSAERANWRRSLVLLALLSTQRVVPIIIKSMFLSRYLSWKFYSNE